MQDFNDLKLRWEEAWRALREAEEIPGTLTLAWYEERNEFREREDNYEEPCSSWGPRGRHM